MRRCRFWRAMRAIAGNLIRVPGEAPAWISRYLVQIVEPLTPFDLPVAPDQGN